MRPFVVAANWKMHKSPSEAVAYFKSFLAKAEGLSHLGSDQHEVIFFVPAIDLWVTQEVLRSTPVKWGAQNCHFETKGAFTGENSPAVLAEISTPYCLVGHSERRAIFRETDEETGKKVAAIHRASMIPMLCVGETLEEREAGRTSEVITRQLKAGLAQRDSDRPVMIAYEPVWAIGTGKVASPAQANEAHVVLRKTMVDLCGPEFARVTPILYGGSVKPENSKEIAAESEVDGFLVGGASLEVDSFLSLCSVTK